MSEAPAPSPSRFGIPLSILLPGLGVLAGLWFLRTALAPFFAAIVLAYLMEPFTTWLARHIPRGWAALAAILLFLVILGLILWAMVPPFVTQGERLVASLPGLRERAIDRWMPWLYAHPVVLAKFRQVMDSLDPQAFLKGLGTAGLGLLGWFLELLTLILVPLIVYYLLVEGPQLTHGLDALVPFRFRVRARALAAEINHRLGGYIRGQLAVTLVMSLLQGLALQILGVPYAWLLGLLAGVSNVIPYSSYITALPFALLFSGLNGAGGGHLLLTVLVFVLVQKTETFYFTPVWVGRASGLHPLEVLLGIFCFGFAFGVLGLIFAVPLMIVCKALFRELITNYKSHAWFNRE